MAGKLGARPQLVLVVQPADQQDAESAEENGGQLNRASAQAVLKQERGLRIQERQTAGVMGGWTGDDPTCPRLATRLLPPQHQAGQQRWNQQAGHHGQAAGQGDWLVVNLALAGFVHQPGAKTPFAPEWQGGQHRYARAHGGEQIDVKGEAHARTPSQSQVKLIQVVHHALDAKAFLHELLAAAAQALAQRGVASQLEQALAQSGQIARSQQEPGLILKADLFGAVGIVGYHRPGRGQRLGQRARQALPQRQVHQEVHDAHQSRHGVRGNKAGENHVPFDS